MDTPALHRTLIVANRTATTMELRCEVRRRARERPTAFALLVPALPPRHDDWTPERAAALLAADAGGPVEALPGAEDPFAAVRRALATQAFDDVIISTRPRRSSAWLRRGLPRRVARLGIPVTVIAQRPGGPATPGTDPAVLESWYRRHDRRR